ncbi:type VI secretion system tip protein VgrG [Variovorax beijingensis]|uniref:Type VI secretion system tip protein VgrG n=1 Tax=Variovorax beijingensis TaxID=2496117 RepID=A0A3P3F2E6_9BURK|nr:type VI secretion system Vgr family protein [Variovorax beijingensis]RRH92486.1 type VI secretion system tip protein VgrG [Variovorax beijingensis]RSZ42921.1 type VI secretion system tip protein VgrG [Variovorax beijingensis]
MKRRVTIQTPLGEALQFHRLAGREALSQAYAFDLDLLGSSNAIDPAALLGKPATVAMETESGAPRYLAGLVTRFGLSHEDNRQAFYKMRFRPWLWLATRRSDFRVFQDQTVPEIIAAVLGRYGYPLEQKLSRSYRTWTYCVQYREDDFSFVSRLCEHEGIYYYFRHEAEQHVLVFADDITGSHAPLPGGETVRYHPHEQAGMTGGLEASERIYEWASSEELRPGHYLNDDYDFEKPRADLSHLRQMPPGHDHDDFERYQWPGGFTQHDDGESYARIRTEEQLSERSRVTGRANRRDLAPGCTFTLTHHPREDQNRQHLLLAVDYDLQENLQASEGAHASEGSVQRFAFEAQPTSYAWRPPRTTAKPWTEGPQTALVVGPAGEEIWTDRYGRIKVQFHWDRIGQKNENASCWVRVSTAWAGATFGAAALPRIGQEVIVDFLNGDPDHPIVTGQVHNADEMPAWQLPQQKQLTGIRSRELGGGRSNHLALDDSNGKVQAQLKSDHQSTSLSLGHVGRIDDVTGRRDDRGQGAELRTDGHGAIRAAQGLLLSTEARPNAQGHITDMPETLARLTEGRDLHESLGQAAQAAKAHEAGDQDEVAKALKAQNDAIKGSGGDKAHGLFPEFQEPHLTLASPAGIQTTAQGSTHIVSGEHTAITSGAHTSVASGNSFLVSAKEAVRLSAARAGIRMTAAKEDIDITAMKASINALAKLNIKLEANRITITARDEVLINGGGSYTRWNANGIESGTNGQWRAHAASHSMVGPKSLPTSKGYEAKCDLQDSSAAGGASASR